MTAFKTGRLEFSIFFITLFLWTSLIKFWSYTVSPLDFGTFQFATFHRGLKNAASCLQYTMDKVLEDIDDIQVYQGQVLVYSNSYEEHLSTLKECFAAFQSYNLKVDVDESLTKFDWLFVDGSNS